MTIDAQAALASANSALQTVAQAFAEKDAALNALSLQADSLSAANVALQAQLDTANATVADLKARLDALQPKPPAPKTVFDYGAKGDGVTDDTVAIQKAIDAGDGRVPSKTPAGQAARFLINSLRVPSGTSFYGLLVAAGQRLVCDPEAVFVVKPNSAPRNMCIRLDGGYMEGGQVLGDRLLHTYSGTTTHEWGYGVQLRGTDSKAVGVKVSQCTGDGFGMSGIRPVLENCISTQNRRQGVSIFGSESPRIINCEFSKTGALEGNTGTNPRCGVDFEPDAGNPAVKDALIEGCSIFDNEVTGLVGWIRSEVVGGGLGLTMRNNKISGSPNAVHMKAFQGAITVTANGNTIKRGSGSGFRIEQGAVVNIDGNVFQQAKPRTTALTVTGTSSATQYDINAISPGKAVVGTNRYE